MSRLAVGDDDHPEAASKNLVDARALRDTGRHDGAAYLGGYVIESSLKTLILHDRSYEAATGVHDGAKLGQWHDKLRRKPFSHDLLKLLLSSVGVQVARYQPDHASLSRVSQTWRESWRYRPEGRVSPDDSADLLDDATRIHQRIVIGLRQDGLL